MKKFASLLGFAFLAYTPLAHADFYIAYQLPGGSPTLCIDNPDSTNKIAPLNCSTSSGGVTIDQLSGSSNSPGSLGATSFQTSSTVSITSSVSGTLDIWVIGQGFMNPHTPPTPIEWSSSLTIIPTASAATTVTSSSCIDLSNNTAPPAAGQTFCKTPDQPELLNSLTGTSNTATSSNSSTSVASLTTTPYSLGQLIVVNLVAGTNIELQTSQDLSQVPEPFAAGLLGTLLVGLSLKFRRKQLKQN